MADRVTGHQLTLAERKKLELSGVVHVESFDDDEVLLDTKLGGLIIKGKNLHVNQLDVVQGNLTIEGLVMAIQYVDDSKGVKGKSKGILERLLK
ncbi:MAG: sporulation protein YabP [Bacillota bacterium]|nr:sporulation protein YabP [Bacillota bacterium]